MVGEGRVHLSLFIYYTPQKLIMAVHSHSDPTGGSYNLHSLKLSISRLALKDAEPPFLHELPARRMLEGRAVGNAQMGVVVDARFALTVVALDARIGL